MISFSGLVLGNPSKHRAMLLGFTGTLLLSSPGCSFLNFSANYYDLPDHYQQEISALWTKLQTELALSNQYQVRVIDGRASDKLNGIPAISGQTVMLPIDFIKYVYQNYYDDRFQILGNVIVHEIIHTEFGLPSKPADKHVQVDYLAIKMLGDNSDAAADYVRSLVVIKNYWFARKGVAGHALNAGWNAANAASLFFGGPAMFADWYATDLSDRIKRIIKQYQLGPVSGFKRSREEKGGV